MADRVSARVKGAKLTQEEITHRVGLGKDIHRERNSMMRDVMDKYERRYKNIQQDVADAKTPMVKSPRGEAVIDVMFSLLTVAADLGAQVLPLKAGMKEQALCTNLERGLEGIQYEIESLTGHVPYREGIHWFLVKGWGVWKTSYIPGLECPIYVEALDPEGVYPVEEQRLLWVVEERERYWGELLKQMGHMKAIRRGRRGLNTWRIPTLETFEADDKVTLTEYWDEDWTALMVEDKLIYNRPNHLGFIPYSFSKCRHTPSTNPAWAGQSIMGPMLGLLELETEILSKFGVSIDLFFYPYILVQDPDGRTVILQGEPGEMEGIPYQSKVTVLQPQSNVAEAQSLLAQAQSLINLTSMPTVMFGEPPGQVQAGYPMALLMNAARTKLAREAGQIEWGIARNQEQILRTVEKYGGLNGGIPIYVGVEGSKRGEKALMTLTDKDVAGHYRSKVTVAPKLPQDLMQMATIAERMRRENKVGEPLISDETILEIVFELDKPDEEKEKLLEQRMMQHPEVREHLEQKWLEDWRRREGIKSPEEMAALARMMVPPAQLGQRGMGQPPGEIAGPPSGGMGLPPSQVMPPAMGGEPPMPPGEMPEDMSQLIPPPRG